MDSKIQGNKRETLTEKSEKLLMETGRENTEECPIVDNYSYCNTAGCKKLITLQIF